MANNIEALRKQANQQAEQARTSFFTTMLNSKMPFLTQVQQGQATRAEYEREFGETVAETLGQQFALGLFQLATQMRNRMEAGMMTEAELLAIPGMPANVLSLDLTAMMTDAKIAMVSAAAEAATKKAEAAKEKVVQLKVEPATLPQVGTVPKTESTSTTTEEDREVVEEVTLPSTDTQAGKEGE